MKKRIFSIIAVVMVLGILYFVAKEDSILQRNREVFCWEKKRLTFPILLERNEIAANEPVTLQDIPAIYEGEVDEIPLDILQDLQQYVLEKDFEGALATYGDNSLCVDIETFAEICPDYNKLYSEYTYKDISDKEEIAADFIYKVELDGIEGDEFLVFYQSYSGDYMNVNYLRDNGNGFEIEHRYAYGGATGEFVMFLREEEGKEVYYKLEYFDKNTDEIVGLDLTRYEVEENEKTEGYYIQMESQTIEPLEVGIQPHFTYLNDRNRYAYDAKEYIEENLWMLFACKEYSRYWWGDEEEVELPYDGSMIEELEVVLENKYRDRGVIRVDYDNDGTKEWFDRTGMYQNRLISVDDSGNFVAESLQLGNFFGIYEADRMWFVQTRDKIVTYQLVNDGEHELIEAYLVEGGVKTPLLTCQVGYMNEIGLSGTAEWWYYIAPLSEDLSNLAAEDKEWFADTCAQNIAELRQENKVKPYEGEVPFDAGLYNMLLEDGCLLLEGETPQALPTYHIDTKADTERFSAQLSEEEARWLSYKWAYLWYTEDGIENYLVYDYVSGNTDIYMLEWYQKTEEGMEYKQRIDFGNYDGYADLLWYEGKLFYVGEIIPYELGQTKGWNITVFEGNGSWSNYTVYYEAEDYEFISVYEEEGAGICNWVQENSQNLLSKIRFQEVSLFDWQEPELTPEESHVFKNLLGGYNTDLEKYFMADINHDGLEEYMILWECYVGDAIGTSYVEWNIHGRTDNEFRKLTLSELTRSSVTGMHNILIDFAEFDGETCMLTVEQIYNSHDYLVRARVIKDGEIEQKGVWLFRAELQELIEY